MAHDILPILGAQGNDEIDGAHAIDEQQADEQT